MIRFISPPRRFWLGPSFAPSLDWSCRGGARAAILDHVQWAYAPASRVRLLKHAAVVKKPIISMWQFGSNLPTAIAQLTLKLQRMSLNSAQKSGGVGGRELARRTMKSSKFTVCTMVARNQLARLIRAV